MPGMVTDLYVAERISDLTKKSELTPQQKLNPKLLAKALDKLYNGGKDLQRQGDEEKAYIHYMKVLNMHSAIKSSREYKKDPKYFNAMLNSTTILDSMDQAEHISESLQSRYKEREQKLAAERQKSPSPEEQVDSGFDDPFDLNALSKTTKTKEPISRKDPVIEASAPSVTVQQVYNWLKTPDTQLLVIDARSSDEFEQSHMKYPSLELLNISEKVLTPGIMPSQLRSKITAPNLTLFDARANYKKILLIDWDSTEDDLNLTTNPLRILKDAIYKWDQQVKLASEPQILEGGYKQWLTYYPQYTTNVQVAGVAPPKAKIDIPDLDSIHYNFDFSDDEEPVPEVRPAPAPQPKLAPMSQPTPSQPATMPAFSRANKPVIQGRLSTVQPTDFSTPQASKQPPSVPPTIASAAAPAPVGTVKPVVPAAVPVRGSPSFPNIDRTLKPGMHSTKAGTGPSGGELSPQELHEKLREQNSRMIIETAARLEKMSEEKAKWAELIKQTESESASLEELRKKKREMEEEVLAQEHRLAQMKKVQMEHKTVPQVDRNLKPELQDWEQRLSELEIDDTKTRGNSHGASSETRVGNSEARLRAVQQSKLIEEHNRMAKRSPSKVSDRKAMELSDMARAAEERQAAQKAKEAEEKKQAEAKAKLAEEQRLAAEKIKEAEEKRQAAARAEEQRLAAVNARHEEEKRKAAEKAKLEEEQRLAAEKVKLEERKKASEKAKLAEEKRLAAERVQLEKKRKATEEHKREQARLEEQRMAEEKAHAAELLRKKSESASLPSGLHRKLDSTGAPVYNDTLEPTIPPSVTPNQAPAKAVSRLGQGYSGSIRSTTRLKSDETTFAVDGEISSTIHSKSKMKKFSSIPNLTQLDDSPTESPPATFDRSSKPVNAIQVPESPRATSHPPFVRMDSRRLANFSPEYGNTQPGLTGLYNMGNTCYMNSALQCLSHTTPLCKYFKEDLFPEDINRRSQKGTQGAVSTEFALLLQCLWSGSYRYIIPKDFKYVFGGEKPDFNHFKQMDSQEFLNTLLDTLHEDLNRQGHLAKRTHPEISSKTPEKEAAVIASQQYRDENHSIIISLFAGMQRSVVQCRACHEKSYKFDHFTFLPLEIRTSYSTSLSKCLEMYQRVDELDGYKCGKCHKKHSVRKLELYTLPNVLIIFFKRFNQFSSHFSKKTNMIDFPEHLQLKGVGEEKHKDYKLYGVVNHYGSLDSGHYTAFCRSIVTNQWHKFNDETVSTVRSFSDIKSSAAYILFYTSVQARTS
ncbi:ubiquitin carboxyl-terminal hydrolase 8-like [Watersipora subatra]|uniref:ubiquitin carboxyl-terminal hydrolase 8-like n=1 Tax=Watersipora subatra TaxID=2589382 RepID=UPI00355B42BA